MPKGRPPLLDYASLKRGQYLVAPLAREHHIRNSASAWGKIHGRKLKVTLVETPRGRVLHVKRVR